MFSHLQHSVTFSVCLLAATAGSNLILLMPSTVQAKEQLPVSLLSPTAMEALVASNAFYADETIEQILQAAQEPAEIHNAATGNPTTPASTSIVYLMQYPDLLQQLDDQLPLTARLGLAARTQIDDVWSAVDRVRSGFREAQSSGTIQPVMVDSTVAYVPTTMAYLPPVYGYYAAGLWADAVVDELQDEYQELLTSSDVSSGAQTITGPYGTATTVNGQVANGNATYTGAAGVATVTGPNGTTVHGVAAGGVAVTDTGNGYQINSAAGGAIVNPATGNYAAGVHTGTGSIEHHSDGSTTFGRDATTMTQSSYGSSTIQHQGSGTAAGIGNSSYSGSTDVSSTHGNVSTATEAGNGQVATTVTTDHGSQTYTAGDGAIGSTSRSDSSTNTRSSSESFSQTERRSFSRDAASGLNNPSDGLRRGASNLGQRTGGTGFSRSSGTLPSSTRGSQFNPSRTKSFSSPGASRGGRSGGRSRGGRR